MIAFVTTVLNALIAAPVIGAMVEKWVAAIHAWYTNYLKQKEAAAISLGEKDMNAAVTPADIEKAADEEGDALRNQ